MSTTPPACTVPRCKATTDHHHYSDASGREPEAFCDEPYCQSVAGQLHDWIVSPRVPHHSRKFLAAEVARLSAELADVHDEVADKKDRLARLSAQAESDALVIASLGRQIAAKVEPEPVEVTCAVRSEAVTVGGKTLAMIFPREYGWWVSSARIKGGPIQGTKDEVLDYIVAAAREAGAL